MADKEANWEYEADDEQGAPKRRVSSVGWLASEYIDHKQGAGWFSLLTLATLALAVAVYFLTKDYFATAIIVIVGIMVGVFARRTPRELKYELSADGLKIEDKLYPMGHFKSFSIIEEGPIASLEFLPLKRYMPPVSAYFDVADQKKIVAVLENYLPYEDRQMDIAERLSRRLRF